MTFGDRLRELRLAKGLTQKELAEAAQIQQSALSRWELGEQPPPFDAVHKLCKALGVRCTVFDGCDFEKIDDKPGRGRPKKS